MIRCKKIEQGDKQGCPKDKWGNTNEESSEMVCFGNFDTAKFDILAFDFGKKMHGANGNKKKYREKRMSEFVKQGAWEEKNCE